MLTSVISSAFSIFFPRAKAATLTPFCLLLNFCSSFKSSIFVLKNKYSTILLLKFCMYAYFVSTHFMVFNYVGIILGENWEEPKGNPQIIQVVGNPFNIGHNWAWTHSRHTGEKLFRGPFSTLCGFFIKILHRKYIISNNDVSLPMKSSCKLNIGRTLSPTDY